MSAKTKIIVLHMKEVIDTGIFLLLAVILAIVLFFMFGSGQKKSASADAKSLYKPGIYTSSIFQLSVFVPTGYSCQPFL